MKFPRRLFLAMCQKKPNRFSSDQCDHTLAVFTALVGNDNLLAFGTVELGADDANTFETSIETSAVVATRDMRLAMVVVNSIEIAGF